MSYSISGKLGAMIIVPIVLVILVLVLLQSRQQSGRLEALQRAYPSHAISIDKQRVAGSGTGTGVRIGSRRRNSSHRRTKYQTYWVVDGKRELASRCDYSGPDEAPTLRCPTFTLSPASAATASTGANQAKPAGARTGFYDVTVGVVNATDAVVTGTNGASYRWGFGSPAVAEQLRAATGRSVRVTWQSDPAGVTRIVAVRPGPQ